MKKIELIKYGIANEAFKEVELTKPSIKPNQVLIDNYAVAIDPYDVKFRNGDFGTETQLPVVLGSSIAGVVLEIGQEVENVKIGDRVIASPHLKTYSHQVPVLSKQVSLLPENIDFVTGAAYALSGQTAYQMIVSNLEVTSDDIVLISGANGSVGTTAIQVAKSLGATVIGLVRNVDEKNNASKFADKIVDSLEGIIFTKALDTVGGQVLEEILKNNIAKVVSIVDGNEEVHSFMKSSSKSLNELSKLVLDEKAKILVEKIYEFNLDNLIKAHNDFEQKKYKMGKIVLKLKN
ncbi:MAG: NADP-dependent oxidoreductase [Lactobacillaceae bacterium]|jgi:NADPH:quinone reductase-like Zn-dependent oxidoreductase|nr:NADP-dependent oxidoreductase [Lactobacillaceae bacterium]